MVKAQISKTETRLDIKCQLIFNKGTNTIQKERIIFSINGVRITGYPDAKMVILSDTHFGPYTKIKVIHRPKHKHQQ